MRSTLEDLLLPHLDSAYTLARYLLRDEDDARDAVQEAYLRAVKHFGTFRGDNARGWILAIVRNTCHTLLTKGRAAPPSASFEDDIHSPVEGAEDAIHDVPAISVREAVDSLPAEFREVVILREVHGYSYKEIGEIIGTPAGTVMSRLARARQRLRERLDPHARQETAHDGR